VPRAATNFPFVRAEVQWHNLLAYRRHALCTCKAVRVDSAIYSANTVLSGHTLKHFAAAAACGALLRYFQKRQPIVVPNAADRPQELLLWKE
jgi:hypothetical protein